MKNKTPEILGIGGIFFKSHNPQKTKEWYERKNLALRWSRTRQYSLLETSIIPTK